MNIPWALAILISALVGAAFFIYQGIHTNKKNKRDEDYQERTEKLLILIEEKLNSKIFSDVIPFTKDKIKQDFYNSALSLIRNSNYHEAIVHFLEYLNKYPISESERAAVLIFIGISYGEIKKQEESISYFKEVISIAIRIDNNILCATAYYNLAVSLYNINMKEEAISAYAKAIHFMPDFPLAWNNQGSVLNELNRNKEAISAIDTALQLRPDFWKAWYNKGNALSDLGLYKEALDAYNNSIDQKPDLIQAWVNKGVAFIELHRFEEALDSLDHALRLQPDFPEAWVNKGSALGGLNRFEESLNASEHALLLKPNSAEAWRNKGASLIKLKRYKEALAAFDMVLHFKPDHSEAWYNKAYTLSLLKNRYDTFSSLTKTFNLDSKYKQLARTNNAFNWLWDDPEFKKLVEDDAGIPKGVSIK